MNIIKAVIEDVPELERLINNAYRGEESKKGWTTEAYLLEGIRINEEGLKEIIREPDSIILKCINDNNEMVGSVYLKKNKEKMYLGMLTVSPVLQTKGIGKKILKTSEEYAVEQKCKVVEMRVISLRYELIAWYERHGYYDTGRIVPFSDIPDLSMHDQSLQFIMMEKKL
jgi:ribosomal protein S18 acetylase RimI-like enzyme